MVSREAVLAKAAEWVGMRERTGNNDILFADDWGITGQSWCFAFTQSCFYYAEPSPSGKLPHQSMYCPYGIQWARDNGQAVEIDQGGPLPGDIVFFSWDMNAWPRWKPGTGDHVGLVEAWDGADTIHTIEGNIGNPQGVYRKTRSISGTVVCFWRPAVYDDDSFGVAGTINPPEEDVTPEQSQQLSDLWNWLNPAAAGRKRGDGSDIRYIPELLDALNLENFTGTNNLLEAKSNEIRRDVSGMASQLAALPSYIAKVLPGGTGIPAPPVPVVDVEASLQHATPAQVAQLGPQFLLAAFNEMFGKQTPPAG